MWRCCPRRAGAEGRAHEPRRPRRRRQRDRLPLPGRTPSAWSTSPSGTSSACSPTRSTATRSRRPGSPSSTIPRGSWAGASTSGRDAARAATYSGRCESRWSSSCSSASQRAAAPPRPRRATSGLLLVEQVARSVARTTSRVSKSYVSAEPEGGGDTQEVELTSTGRTPTGSLRLGAAVHAARAGSGPCDGNCGYLDPPTDPCSTSVRDRVRRRDARDDQAAPGSRAARSTCRARRASGGSVVRNVPGARGRRRSRISRLPPTLPLQRGRARRAGRR